MKAQLRCHAKAGVLHIELLNMEDVVVHACVELVSTHYDEVSRELRFHFDPRWVPFVGRVRVLSSEPRLVAQKVILPGESIRLDRALPETVDVLRSEGANSRMEGVPVAGRIARVKTTIAIARTPLEAVGATYETCDCVTAVDP